MWFYKDFYTDFDEKKFQELLDFMKLEKHEDNFSFKGGDAWKIKPIFSIIKKCKIYILDEPIAGVDPVARDQILDAIIANYNEESSMIITTHLVRDMESIFDDVVFLKDGEIILQGVQKT